MKLENFAEALKTLNAGYHCFIPNNEFGLRMQLGGNWPEKTPTSMYFKGGDQEALEEKLLQHIEHVAEEPDVAKAILNDLKKKDFEFHYTGEPSTLCGVIVKGRVTDVGKENDYSYDIIVSLFGG